MLAKMIGEECLRVCLRAWLRARAHVHLLLCVPKLDRCWGLMAGSDPSLSLIARTQPSAALPGPAVGEMRLPAASHPGHAHVRVHASARARVRKTDNRYPVFELIANLHW